MAEAVTSAIIRTGNHGIAAVANHNSVITLRCITSCIFYDGSTYMISFYQDLYKREAISFSDGRGFSIPAKDFIRIWTGPHIEQTHRNGSRVRLDFSSFMKSMRSHNGNSDSRCEYVAQRYVGDTALIEPFNSIQSLLTIPMYSNMILNQNSRTHAEIWRWN